MKTKWNKIWVGWMAFLFIVIHFGFIISYAMPSPFSNPKLRAFATPYVEPVFTQTWGMFVPTPIMDAKVEVKFYFDNDSTDWINPTEEAWKKHAFYRGSFHGELVLAESNLMYWFGLDMSLMQLEIGQEFPMERVGEFQKGYSYFKIKNYLSGNARYLYDKSPKRSVIRCYIENVVTGEKGIMELPPFNY